MRILSAFLLLAVVGALALFLTFTSSWGAIFAPQMKAPQAAAIEEAATPTPDWTGKLTVTAAQSVVLRGAPVPSAPVVGMLRRDDTVALTGCDEAVLWCQTEAGAWLLAYMVSQPPGDLAILDHPGVTVKMVQSLPTSTAEVDAPPPATPTPAPISLALLLPTPTPMPLVIEAVVNDAANLRSGPGTDYPVVGKAAAGERVMLSGKDAGGEWYRREGGAWIAAFLVDGFEGELPVIVPDAVAPEHAAPSTEAAPTEAAATEAAATEAAATETAATEAAATEAAPTEAAPTEAAPTEAAATEAAATEAATP